MIIFVAICFILGGIAAGIWFVFHDQLTGLVRWVRWAELWVDKLLVGDDYAISTDETGTMSIGQWRAWLRVAPVKEIAPQHIKVVTLLAVPPLRIVFLVMYGLMGLHTIFFGHGTQYRRRMNLDALMREQARSFPTIQPFLKFNPRSTPQRSPGMPVPAQLPLFSEALSPEEWIAYHEIAFKDGQLDRNKAWQALSLQLGRRWEGPMKLPLHAQGLYAAYALKHARKRKDSELMIHDLARSWSADKGFRPSSKLKAQIRKVLKDPKIGGALAKYTDQHAWETTAMLRALARARQEGGVLAPAEFLWLRGQDRTLWYPMNNLGRKAYHAEAAGALVHFTNELIAGQKIPTPRFDDAIKVLEAHMNSKYAREIPPLDKSAGGAQFRKK